MSLGERKRLLNAIAALRRPSPGGTAERRQITVRFIDLVGSTRLASLLDPEDMRDVLTAYQNCSTEVIERFEGYVAKCMDDGMRRVLGLPPGRSSWAI